MENNIFAEQIVAARSSASVVLKKLLAVLVCVCLIVILSKIPSLSSLIPVICAGLLLIAVALVRSFNVEYEYTLSGDDFSVDIIRGRTNRKTKLSVSLSRVSALVSAADPRAGELKKEASRRLDFSSSPDASRRVAILCDTDTERVFFIIEPNEKMYSHITAALPAAVRMSLKNND